ncbi:cAMP-dependent protein kinase catalytic subunit-like, partial [Drosophila albomicans]|uniref:cAMP-dependent protein kinase catalytic subunit-like n=1 Tax=Drosophila albomicans TaxID=7291 RepID=A0A9C6SU11_DROAB
QLPQQQHLRQQQQQQQQQLSPAQQQHQHQVHFATNSSTSTTTASSSAAAVAAAAAATTTTRTRDILYEPTNQATSKAIAANDVVSFSLTAQRRRELQLRAELQCQEQVMLSGGACTRNGDEVAL